MRLMTLHTMMLLLFAGGMSLAQQPTATPGALGLSVRYAQIYLDSQNASPNSQFFYIGGWGATPMLLTFQISDNVYSFARGEFDLKLGISPLFNQLNLAGSVQGLFGVWASGNETDSYFGLGMGVGIDLAGYSNFQAGLPSVPIIAAIGLMLNTIYLDC